MADFNLSFVASELNAAITKANAAAPQSTTYTKTEVDAALAEKADSSDVYDKDAVDDLLEGKVDVETGKGLSTNDFTNTDKANLTTALTKANAAAPQSTTYTKSEVDAALSAKLNTADVDDALSGTSANPVQNKAVHAPVARLVDAGAKNLLKITATSKTINGVTFTVNVDQTVTVNGTNTGTGSAAFVIVPNQQVILIPDGDYWLLGCPQGGGADTFDIRFYRYSPNASAYDTGSGAAIHKSGNTTDSNIAIVVKSGVTVNNITFKPMLCTAEDYAISPEFVPYAPSNLNLYNELTSIAANCLQRRETFGASGDFNAQTTVGIYRYNGTPLNHPTSDSSEYGLLMVLAYGSYVSQICHVFNPAVSGIYIRTLVIGSAWSAWNRLTGTAVT